MTHEASNDTATSTSTETSAEAQTKVDTTGSESTTESKEAAEVKTFDEAYVKTLRDEAAGHRVKGQKAESALDQITKILNPDATDKADPDNVAR